jgi:hypothetical protein
MFRSMVFGMFIMALVLYHIRSLFITQVFPTETIQRIMDAILQQSEYISTVQSPHLALLQSRECQASLQTLIHLVGGGQSTIDTLCGIDTERLQNILHFQEKQIHSHITVHK